MEGTTTRSSLEIGTFVLTVNACGRCKRKNLIVPCAVATITRENHLLFEKKNNNNNKYFFFLLQSNLSKVFHHKQWVTVKLFFEPRKMVKFVRGPTISSLAYKQNW